MRPSLATISFVAIFARVILMAPLTPTHMQAPLTFVFVLVIASLAIELKTNPLIARGAGNSTIGQLETGTFTFHVVRLVFPLSFLSPFWVWIRIIVIFDWGLRLRKRQQMILHLRSILELHQCFFPKACLTLQLVGLVLLVKPSSTSLSQPLSIVAK